MWESLLETSTTDEIATVIDSYRTYKRQLGGRIYRLNYTNIIQTLGMHQNNEGYLSRHGTERNPWRGQHTTTSVTGARMTRQWLFRSAVGKAGKTGENRALAHSPRRQHVRNGGKNGTTGQSITRCRMLQGGLGLANNHLLGLRFPLRLAWG